MVYENTINKILNRLSKEIPIAEVGDILETQKTIYPRSNISRLDKNIIVDSMEITAPLACSSGWKQLLIKEHSSLCQIFKEFDRGDILKVKAINGGKVTVENLSIEEEFRKDFVIDKIDIIKKNFNLIKRKSIGLLKTLEKIEK